MLWVIHLGEVVVQRVDIGFTLCIACTGLNGVALVKEQNTGTKQHCNHNDKLYNSKAMIFIHTT